MSAETPCQEWSKARARRGYGAQWYQGKQRPAHRVAYAQAHKIDIDGPDMPEIVRHTCDNPPCINPAHLQGGTHADNMRDMFERSRNVSGDAHWTRRRPELLKRGREHWTHQKPERMSAGERHSSAKLKERNVREIRRAFAAGEKKRAELADQFGVSLGTIKAILSRRKWKHVE